MIWLNGDLSNFMRAKAPNFIAKCALVDDTTIVCIADRRLRITNANITNRIIAFECHRWHSHDHLQTTTNLFSIVFAVFVGLFSEIRAFPLSLALSLTIGSELCDTCQINYISKRICIVTAGIGYANVWLHNDFLGDILSRSVSLMCKLTPKIEWQMRACRRGNTTH